MDELQRLRERHDALPDPSSRSVAEARARLSAHMNRPAWRRSRAVRRLPVRPLWGIGLAAACATAVLVANTLRDPVVLRPAVVTETPRQHANGTTPPPQALRLRPVADARDLADNAASLAAAEDDATPAPHQWAYMKKRVARAAADGGERLSGFPKETTTHEMWRRADDKKFASILNGRLKVFEGSEFEVPYPYLLSLPTEPGALLDRVYEQIDAEAARQRESWNERVKQRFGQRGPEKNPAPTVSAEERRMWAFQYIAQGMRDAVLPSRLRAAMYGAMARIPGVTFEDRASDLARRKGVTLYRVQSGYLRDEIFVDPKTYEYLGYRTIAVRDHDEDHITVKKGQILGWDALMTSAVVEKAGHRP